MSERKFIISYSSCLRTVGKHDFVIGVEHVVPLKLSFIMIEEICVIS